MYEKVNGSKIKKAIKDAGFTQEELAKKIKTNRVVVSNWIRDIRNPKMESLEKIAKATGKPLEYFISDNSVNIASSGDNATITVNQKDFELMKKENELLRRELEIERKEKELLKKTKGEN
jgi:Predicted transcriptional regulators